MSATPVPTPTPTAGTARIRALALVGAVLLAGVIWLLAEGVLGVGLRVPDGPGSTSTSELALPTVLVAVAVVSLAGWGLLALLERFTRRARGLWTGVALAVLGLSLVAPLFAEGLAAGGRAALVCLHLAVGAALIPAYRKGARTL
ncbi:DUF6069 family protein [Streptomyces albidoflavus]